MKKLRSNKGFTLAEMLISVLLLGFVSMMAAVMTSAVLNSTVTMKETAQAEILGSEVFDNIQRQLRFAQNVRVGDDGVIMFDFDSANTDYTFGIADGKVIIGRVTEDGGVDGSALFDGVSYGDLSVSILDFSLSEDKSSVIVSASVSFGDKVVWSSDISVRPVNGINK